jgi:orotidine-5'-phosphate decarboxylase
MLEAAAAGVQEGSAGAGYAPTLLGVTILTSLDRTDLNAVGLAPGRPVRDVVVDLGRMAVDAGCGGLIAAGSDARALRAAVGPDAKIVTPGVRPIWAAAQDQKRIVTPAAALAAGADYIVVGRAVTAAPDPAGAFERLME